MEIFSTTDIGVASYLFTKLKGSFIGIERRGAQAGFRFRDSAELRKAVSGYFCDHDGFLSYRNAFNNLKTLANQAIHEVAS